MKKNINNTLLMQITTKDKLSRNIPLTEQSLTLLFKDLIRPILNVIASFRVPYKVIVDCPCNPLPDKPIIYAVNHFCFGDAPIIGRCAVKRAHILAGKQRLGFSDWLFFVLNGVIFVDRKDKADLSASKLAMTAYLKKNRSIAAFPEGTWNLTENQLMLPIKWGIIDIAQETDAQIIPVVFEYDRENKKCHVRFNTPLVFSYRDNKADSITTLRDTMATMRWGFWERNGIFKRENLDIISEKKNMQYSIEEYPTIDWEYESSCIYHPYIEPNDAFEYLNQLTPCKENAFLFRKRI